MCFSDNELITNQDGWLHGTKLSRPAQSMPRMQCRLSPQQIRTHGHVNNLKSLRNCNEFQLFITDWRKCTHTTIPCPISTDTPTYPSRTYVVVILVLSENKQGTSSNFVHSENFRVAERTDLTIFRLLRC